jgi:hypothetical protein
MGCNADEFEQVIIEMIAVATGEYEGADDACDPWTSDNRADIDRWQATLCGGYPIKSKPQTALGGRMVAPVEVYKIIKDVVIDKENVSAWSRRIAAALSEEPSPEPRAAA